MIIMEGPDFAGKTTALHALIKEINSRNLYQLSYAHLTPPNKAFHPFWDHATRIHPCLAWDRFYLSELAYAVPAGRPQILVPVHVPLLDCRIRQAGGVVIVLLPTDAFIKKVAETRGPDSMFNLDLILRVAERYRSLAGYSNPLPDLELVTPFITHTKLLDLDKDGNPEFVGPADIKRWADSWEKEFYIRKALKHVH